jgi:acetylornithine deacetylase/succinyl-diaminopimelate desuccinylase-like protein
MGLTKDEAFNPDHSVAQLGSVLQERDALDMTVRISLVPELASPEARKEVERDFKERIAAVARKYRAVSLECRRVYATHRFFTDPSSTFVSTLKADMTRTGLPSDHQVGNCATEAAHFAEKGYETIAFGAGEAPALVNRPNEKVRLTDLQSAVRFYSRAIEAFCLRGI